MEGDVARAGGRATVDEARLGQLAAGGIEAEHEGAVEPQVRNHHEPSGGVEYDVMRVRARLTHAMRSRRALELHQLGLVTQRAVLGDGKHRHRAAGVIRDDEKLAAGIERLAHAVLAAGIGAAQQLELSALGIDGERGGVVLVAVNRIKRALVLAEHEERGVHQVADLLNVGPGACCRSIR